MKFAPIGTPIGDPAWVEMKWVARHDEPGAFRECAGVTVTLPPPGTIHAWCLDCARADARATACRLTKAAMGQPGDIVNICRTCGHISYYRREAKS